MHSHVFQKWSGVSLGVAASLLAMPVCAQPSRNGAHKSEISSISSNDVRRGAKKLYTRWTKPDVSSSMSCFSRPGTHLAPRAPPIHRLHQGTVHSDPKTDMVACMIAWIATRTGWHVRKVPPIRFVSHAQLVEMYFGKKRKSKYIHVYALYSDESRAVYLPETWTPNDLRDRSALLHELVHHLQAANKISATCPAEYERQAYDLQIAWLYERGIDDPYEFLHTDPRVIYVLSRCPEF